MTQRILARSNHTLQLYPRSFAWCLREGFRLIAIAGFVWLIAKITRFI